jgi:hypothetical protein
MTDDKEERIHLELTVDEFQELIEGYTGDSEGVYEKLKNAVPSLAPKHTNEEYEQLYLDWEGFAELVEAAIQRINEQCVIINDLRCELDLAMHELEKAKADSHEAWKHRGFHDSEEARK